MSIEWVEEVVGACFLEGGPLEGAVADQEHLLDSKRKKWKT